MVYSNRVCTLFGETPLRFTKIGLLVGVGASNVNKYVTTNTISVYIPSFIHHKWIWYSDMIYLLLYIVLHLFAMFDTSCYSKCRLSIG